MHTALRRAQPAVLRLAQAGRIVLPQCGLRVGFSSPSASRPSSALSALSKRSSHSTSLDLDLSAPKLSQGWVWPISTTADTSLACSFCLA